LVGAGNNTHFASPGSAMHPTCFSPTIRAAELKPLAWKCPEAVFAHGDSPSPYLHRFYSHYLLKALEMRKAASFCKKKAFNGLGGD